MDITQILKTPESKTLEFKQDLSSPDGVLRTLIAFANTSGGKPSLHYPQFQVYYSCSAKIVMELTRVQYRKPNKKTDRELWNLIAEMIASSNYVFLNHAKMRLKDRNVTDIDVLDILENKDNRNRKRNKSKDTYTPGYQDWNYCIEGKDLDGKRIRIIISFDSELMLVITVIRLDD